MSPGRKTVTLGKSLPWEQEGGMLRFNPRKADHLTPGAQNPCRFAESNPDSRSSMTRCHHISPSPLSVVTGARTVPSERLEKRGTRPPGAVPMAVALSAVEAPRPFPRRTALQRTFLVHRIDQLPLSGQIGNRTEKSVFLKEMTGNAFASPLAIATPWKSQDVRSLSPIHTCSVPRRKSLSLEHDKPVNSLEKQTRKSFG